jgi:hypothetical protein
MTLDEYLEELDAHDNENCFIEERTTDRISKLPTLIPARGVIHCYHCSKDRDRSYTFYYAWDKETDIELFKGGMDYQLACSDCIDERVRPFAKQDLEDLKDISDQESGGSQ